MIANGPECLRLLSRRVPNPKLAVLVGIANVVEMAFAEFLAGAQT